MKLSIVSTLYKSPEEVPDLVSRCVDAASAIFGQNFEIVLVDDACPEDSGAVAEGMRESIPQLRVIRLSRNFGQHHALMEGFRQARGDLVFALDGDLEEDPAWLSKFHQVLIASKSDVVYGYQDSKRRGFLDGMQGRVGYALIRRLTNLAPTPNLVTARLMTREYVDALTLFQEKKIWLAGLWELAGFTQIPVLVTKTKSSETTYTSAWKIRHLLSVLLTFSQKPLHFVFGVGITGGFLSIVVVAYVVFRWLSGDVLDGWPSVLASLWIIGGTILFCLSLIAYYIATIFVEVKNRPNVIIRSPKEIGISDEP